MTDLELETWIVGRGNDVIEKKAVRGQAALFPFEKVIYCVWVADYGMRMAAIELRRRTFTLDFRKKPPLWRSN